jgi:hypothetical protein
MNPDYLWITTGVEFIALFVLGPILGFAIAYDAWKCDSKRLNLQRYLLLCGVLGITSFLLFGLATWIDADVRTPQYFFQFALVVIGSLFFHAAGGCLFPLMLTIWRWHQSTRLQQQSRDSTES